MTQQLTGAQALAQALLKMGATRLYGIIGTSNVAFVDALYESGTGYVTSPAATSRWRRAWPTPRGASPACPAW